MNITDEEMEEYKVGMERAESERRTSKANMQLSSCRCDHVIVRQRLNSTTAAYGRDTVSVIFCTSFLCAYSALYSINPRLVSLWQSITIHIFDELWALKRRPCFNFICPRAISAKVSMIRPRIRQLERALLTGR